MMQKSQILNTFSAASKPALPPWKLVQLPPQAVPGRQAPATYMAPQPLGPLDPRPGSSDVNRNTRRRLDTLFKPRGWTCTKCCYASTPCEKYHAGVSTWSEKFAAPTTPSFSKPTTIHCKTGSLSARLAFETRAKCQDCCGSVQRMMVSRFQTIGHCAIPVPISLSASPNRLKIVGRRLARFCSAFFTTLQEIFHERYDRPFSLFLHLTHVHNPEAFFGSQKWSGETSFQASTTRTRSAI